MMKRVFLLFAFMVGFGQWCPSACAEVSGYEIIKTSDSKLTDALGPLGYSSGKNYQKFSEVVKQRFLKEYQSELLPENLPEGLEFQKYVIQKKKGVPEKVIFTFWLPSTWEYYTLFFLKNGQAWDMNPNMVKIFLKYETPLVEVVDFRGEAFGAFLSAGGGSGGEVVSWEIYPLRQGRIEKALACPNRGHRMGPPFPYDVEIKTSHLLAGQDSSGDYLGYELSATYSGSDDSGKSVELFSKKYFVCYRWDKAHKKFVADSKKSELKGDPWNGVFYAGPVEKFFMTFYKELLAIAQGGNPAGKSWLRDNLNDFDLESKQALAKKNELKKLLSK